MRFQKDDGGRALAGLKGEAGDCVTRSIVIATGLPYKEVYDKLAEGTGSQRRSKRQKEKRSRSAREGINTSRKWFKDYMTSLGFKWVPTMGVGTGCIVHMKEDELPYAGRLVVSLSKHYTAVIDGVIHDTHDPSRDGSRCVYGYWVLQDRPRCWDKHEYADAGKKHERLLTELGK